jgi:outer membrane protein insertion porin family
MTIEISRRGYPFGNVRPRGDRNVEARTIGVVYVVDEGVRAYIERINIRGNTRTRDYVIRREFDISEGDPYNRALIDRAERRIKNLNFFKSVKITNEPGSAPDRVVVNVDVVEQSTGDFSVAGGFSTSDGFLAEVSIAERNLLGTGRYARAAASYGQYSRGGELNFVEPYFLDLRMSMGIDLFIRETLASDYLSYGTRTTGGNLKFGIPLREELALQLRYSLYQQEITLPDVLTNCNNINPDFLTTFPTPQAYADNVAAGGAFAAASAAAQAVGGPVQTDCVADGEASLPVRKELAGGRTLTSMVGYGITFNTLDNNRHPTNGLLISVGQDFAGAGGDVNFIRSTVDVRSYYEIVPDLVSLLRLQGGNLLPWGGQELRMLDHFKMGANLVRGFQPSGFGPRDITPGTANDALGGTLYWGATLELQYPFYFLPKDTGFRGAVFADAGSLFGYKGPTSWAQTGEVGPYAMQYVDDNSVRASLGASLIWDSPFGPLRFDFAYPILSQSYDRTQWFRFGGGTRF